jgi:endoglucanase
MDLKSLIFFLSSLNAPAGFEKLVSEEVVKLLGKCCDNVRIDSLGNIIAIKRCGKENAPLIMLDSHFDEVGFIVTGITDEGFLHFAKIGSPDERVLPGAEVLVLTDPPLPGIVACLPPHIQSAEERGRFVDTDAMSIDIGFSKEKATKLVKPGTPVVSLNKTPVQLKNNRFSGKALDNRLCVAVCISSLYALKGKSITADVAFVASVQEEAGCRGAGPAAFGLKPDVSIVLDATFGDSPDTPPCDSFALGSGVTLCRGPETEPRLLPIFFFTAEKLGVPCNPEVYGGSTGTNARAIQISGYGVPTAVLSVPVRYLHTSVETADLEDAELAVKLLVEFFTHYREEEEKCLSI